MTTIDYAKARELMVEQQVRPWDVLDPRVLDVLAELPREAFVADAHKNLAYADLALPLAHGEFMMKPVMEGRTLQSLAVDPTDDVLEIGTGSGYLTACLGRLAREVVSLEIHPDLAATARQRLAAQTILNAQVVDADALNYSTDRRFNAICVTGAVSQIPAQWLQWLQPGGRLFVVRGRSPAMEAVLVGGGERNEVNASRIQSLFETDLAYLQGAAPAPAFEF
ncbi:MULTISPECIES: protein-L-isoaspartate O-methyltransferase family protein [Lysobacter]|uniref:Protein-L-isoaspartate O-methyltransferase n=2 Tax=Lysobacter TaxID=68 RepID=A0A0S2DCC6_LYSEN|nr:MULTISPECIES: protein-L-isoaspartate O-methyltransferase [Lysobacter]ALN56166.1 protein-L-isoaspartate(D-aspartate) O-methyltransferase (PCMT) [Lysobacter enzymogenes]QCW25077.1 protein-L-isoaspartate O-methyltransferase [Lysobacter enzymogenes]QQQ00451.1 protein-L-isoaspartate O-methyltransferase [Lysobacter enzymogenes]UZW59898.1 protein-L-isoaspartate O-methyltransferase [Lysobacter enzymogenes]WMT03736.1 protein-L-isoaspartate O-methyltransferase [Lysobacter yananisis]